MVEFKIKMTTRANSFSYNIIQISYVDVLYSKISPCKFEKFIMIYSGFLTND